MVDYFFFIFCFLSIINIKIKGFDCFFHDYMYLENTNSIKGIFVWLIIFCHKSQYGSYKDYLFKKIVKNLGQQVVSIFFFYSGFGIIESFKKKGIIYLKSLPRKAFILFMKFQIIVFFFLLTNILILKNAVSFKRYLLSFFFKYSLGNSNWFAFTIILFYLYSYLSFRFITNKIFYGIIIISFLCFLHSLFVYIYFYPKMIYSVDTVFCFVTGFYFSCIKKYFDKIIMKNDINYFLIVTNIIFFYYKFFIINKLIYISIRNVLFVILVILISLKVKVKNDFLLFLNKHSFSIYLLQRLIIRIVYIKNIFKNNDFIQISFEFTAIFYISCLFDKYSTFIDTLIKCNSKKIEFSHYIPINYNCFNNIIDKC